MEIQQNSDVGALLPFLPKIWEAPQAQLGNNLLQLLSGFPLWAAVGVVSIEVPSVQLFPSVLHPELGLGRSCCSWKVWVGVAQGKTCYHEIHDIRSALGGLRKDFIFKPLNPGVTEVGKDLWRSSNPSDLPQVAP